MRLKDSIIFIDNLRLYAYHGVMEQEQRTGAWFVVSLRVHYNILKAMESDNVDDTLSYADLADIVKKEMATSSRLLEHVAGRIANAILLRFPETESVVIRLTKENPPMGIDCDGAGVEVEVRSE